MKRDFRINFPIIYGVALTIFTIFTLLETFVIPHEYSDVSFNFDLSSSNSYKSNSYSYESLSSVNMESISCSNSSIEETYNEYFTKEEIMTETSYSGPNLNVNITNEIIQTQNTKTKKMSNTRVYTAEIRIRDYTRFKTALAQDKFGNKIVEKTSSMAKRNNAIFAINGDYYGATTRSGYVVRNGVTLRTTPDGYENLSVLKDGSFETYLENKNSLDEILLHDPWQVFSFGPTLIKDSEIIINKKDEVEVSSKKGNQRTAIGMIEPLHYICVVCNGRTNDDYGMSLLELAEFMIDKGVKIGYNLDGGGSSTMWFKGQTKDDGVVNFPTQNSIGSSIKAEREISDCVYFN